MGRSAKSLTKKSQINQEEKENLTQLAVATYRAELKKPKDVRKGARVVCKEVADEHKRKTGREVRVDHNTMLRRLNGGKSHAESHAEKSWLSANEVETVINFAEELSERGIPLTLKTLEEHVNFILRARLGKIFTGVGKNWVARFLEKHSDRLRTFFASPLERSRARAVNPTTHKMFFDLWEDTVKKYNIQPQNIFAADETGFMPGRACKSKVIGKSTKKSQRRKESGNRSIISVMPTICADGTSIPPLVIFSGAAYLVSWKQDNPLNASIGYQKKGYMDGELGIDWIKHFYHYVKDKLNGEDCGLLLDCHRSRLTLEFLLYCRKKRIHVVCYPSHSTHIYQGLDVVIFATLKKAFSKEMLNHEEKTGQGVCKENFLAVYAPAHIAAFTESSIKAAFARTGIYPLDRTAINLSSMKPSIESSTQGDGLPLPQRSPVRALANLIKAASTTPNATHLTGRGPFAAPTQAPNSIPIDPVLLAKSRLASQQLAKTSAGFLVSSSPVKSSSNLPIQFREILLPKPPPQDLLTLVPENRMEERLIDTLGEYAQRESRHYAALLGMQVELVLQNMYCERLRSQLNAKETKEALPKGTGKLASDGLPRCLTNDEFVDEVRAYTERLVAEAAEKERKKDAKAAYLKELELWKKSEEQRKSEKARRTAVWRAEVDKWDAERKLAAVEKRKARWTKPVLGRFPKALPKPKVPKATAGPVDVEEEVIEAANASFSSTTTTDDD